MRAAGKRQSKMKSNSKTLYINYITVVFCLIYGFKSLDGASVTYFSEKLINDLHFTTSQYSSLSSIYYLSYGISSIVFGRLLGRSSRRKSWLVPMTLCAAATALLTARVHDYTGLAICRFLAGASQGCSLAIMMGIIAKNLVREDYGMRNGFISFGAALIGSALGPLIIASLTRYYEWNTIFLITGVLMLCSAILVQFTVKEVTCAVRQDSGTGRKWSDSAREMFRNRNFVLCFVIGLLETAANLCIGVFAPLYFTDVMGFDSIQKGWFLSLKGFAFIPLSLVIPMLADRFPTKRIMAATFACSVIAPLCAFLIPGTMASAVILAVFGSWAGVTVSLFVYMIPRASLPEHLHSEANGFILGCSVLVGGCLAPILMGALVESGRRIEYVMGICGTTLAACAVLSCFIRGNTGTPRLYKTPAKA